MPPPAPENIDGDAGTGQRGREPESTSQTRNGWQWVFRNRQTGRLSLIAWPNVPLSVWIVTAVARRVPFVDGRTDTVLGLVGSVALVVWAVGELWHGVSPWRRMLGFGVLLGVVIAAVR